MHGRESAIIFRARATVARASDSGNEWLLLWTRDRAFSNGARERRGPIVFSGRLQRIAVSQSDYCVRTSRTERAERGQALGFGVDER